MSSDNVNNKSAKKNIRFPHELIADINDIVEQEKKADPTVTFSGWVIRTCREKVEDLNK